MNGDGAKLRIAAATEAERDAIVAELRRVFSARIMCSVRRAASGQRGQYLATCYLVRDTEVLS